MNRSFVVAVVAVAGFAVCSGTWIALPWLQDSRQSAESEISARLERARRLLYKHDFGLTRKSLLLKEAREAGVEVAKADAATLADAAADEYQTAHERLWTSFQPVDISKGQVRDAKASYGNMERQISDGVTARNTLIDENDRWLNKALAEVEEAIATVDRNIPPSTYAEAHRLKGVILYHLGINEWLSAQAKRREAQPLREQLAGLAARVDALKASSTALTDSDIQQRSAGLKEREAQVALSLSEDQEELQELDRAITDVKTKLATAESKRDAARQSVEALMARGIDLSSPNGAESFQSEVLEQNRAFRAAEREVSALNSGTYEDAALMRPEDYLGGTYVQIDSPDEPSVAYGLQHYQDKRAALAAEVQIQTAALEALRTDEVVQLELMKSSLQEEQDQAAKMIAEAIQNAQESYDEISRIESEAYVLEEKAMQFLEKSASASSYAATSARDWTQDARQRTSGVSLTAQSRSAFAPRLDDDWMSGHIQAQEADARLALAWVQYGRFSDYGQTLKALESAIAPLELKEANLEDVRAKIDTAHSVGVEAVSGVLSLLEKSHRSAEQHWTITAQAAGAQYMLVLFGHQAALHDAVEAYRSALKGREDQVFSEVLVNRVKELERR